MAKILGVSESGYYKYLSRLSAPPTDKELADIALAKEIYSVFQSSRGSFGSRKITYLINRNRSNRINHKRIERLMQEYGLFSRVTRKYILTTDSNHDHPIADNLISRNFSASMPNEKFVSDTTAIQTDEGILYVAGILDLYGRMPAGLAMSKHNDQSLVMSALQDMLQRRLGHSGSIIHSDRGSTYSSETYRKMIDNNGLVCSMSRKGDCWDNAPMESFWGKMKDEWLSRKYKTIVEAMRDVYEYVWGFYPYERPHESFGYATPAEYYNSFKTSIV